MSTDTTAQLLKTIQNRLRSYSSPSSATVNALKAQVYLDVAPPDATFPYIVLTIGDGVTDPDFGNRCEKLVLEAMVHGRAREDVTTVHALVDLARQALLTYREASADFGLTYFTGVRREALTFPAPPSAPEELAVRLLFDAVTWPAVLTDALT